MIELKNDSLIFSFSEIHPKARLTIDFQRTHLFQKKSPLPLLNTLPLHKQILILKEQIYFNLFMALPRFSLSI